MLLHSVDSKVQIPLNSILERPIKQIDFLNDSSEIEIENLSSQIQGN